MISEEEHEQMPEPVRERLEALKDAPGSVIVVGSMNADYTVTTKRLPKPGETVNGGAMKVLPGGKGANQASAAARLGVNVQLLGAVGEDSNADFLLSKLDEAGVDTADILHVEGPSGTTVITVSAEGENTIVYSPGSNAKASAGYVQSHRTTIAECAVLGLCLESPISTVIAAAQTAHDAGVTVLLNDSPFMDELPHELVEATDILLVNQHEVAQLLGLPDDDVESLDWYEVAERFTDYGFDRAIVTLGASGSVVISAASSLASKSSMQWTPPVAATRSWGPCWLAWPPVIRCCNPRKSAPTSPPMRPPSLVPKVPTVPPKKSSPTSADL